MRIIHRPLDSSRHLDANSENNFEKINCLAAEERKETIIIGDLNCYYLSKANNKPIKRILQLYGFKQVIKRSTRRTPRSRSLIDIISTTHESRIPKHYIIANAISGQHLTRIKR